MLNQICSVGNWLITDSCNINNIIASRRHCMATPLFRTQVRLVLNAKTDIANACTIRWACEFTTPSNCSLQSLWVIVIATGQRDYSFCARNYLKSLHLTTTHFEEQWVQALLHIFFIGYNLSEEVVIKQPYGHFIKIFDIYLYYLIPVKWIEKSCLI